MTRDKKKRFIKDFNSFINENKKVKITNTSQLQDFFEENDFNVDLFEQNGVECAEIEKWTNGGVDMIITLVPFSVNSFKEYVENFNIDEEIDLYRQDKLYKNNFTLKQSLNDFENFHRDLKTILSSLL